MALTSVVARTHFGACALGRRLGPISRLRPVPDGGPLGWRGRLVPPIPLRRPLADIRISVGGPATAHFVALALLLQAPLAEAKHLVAALPDAAGPGAPQIEVLA